MEEKFLSETASLKCRFCKKQLLRKNYKDHIKKVHPGENFDDLKPYGHSTLINFTKINRTHLKCSFCLEGVGD